MSATVKATERRLTITACAQIAQAPGKEDGQPGWVLYRVAARGGDGQPVSAELRSFDPIEPGLVDDFEVTRRDDPRRGATYTLRRSRRGKVGERVGELERQVADHEKRIVALQAAPPF